MRRVRVVAALMASARDPSRFLVQQRLPGGSRGLLWEFPGGKVEAGESDAQALSRECVEELGVQVEVGELLWKDEHTYSDLHVELLLYRAHLRSGEPQPLGANELRHLTPREMQELPFCEADLPLLQALVDGTLS